MKSPDPNTWLDLHEAGFSIFPLNTHSKRPALDWSAYQSRKPTEAEVEQWAVGDIAYNVGIVTGRISGIVVLDLDSADALAIAEQRGLPLTVEAQTPRGRHIFFRHPGHVVRNVAGREGGKLPHGLDVRGDGGYVVGHGSYFVPSKREREDGKVEGAYRWREGRSPTDVQLADMPTWLLEACTAGREQCASKAATPADAKVGGAPYGLAALERECDNIRNAQKGCRNDQLNRSAFAVSQLVAGGELDEQHARTELEQAASSSGLQSAEVKATIASGWTAGTSNPRAAPAINKHPATSSASATPTPVTPLLRLRTAAEAASKKPPAREYLLQEWLPVGATTCLFGDGGTGKSLVAMMMATAVAAGRDIWGLKTLQTPTMAFYCEDDDHELDRRQQAVNEALGLHPDDLEGCLFESRFGKSSLLGQADKSGEFVTNELFGAIRETALAKGARLIILDNINMVFGDNINDPGVVTRFMAKLNGLALDVNGAVLLLGHIAKGEGSKFAGTMAWSNASRNRLFLGRPDNPAEAARNPDLRCLSRDKSNYARTGEQLSLIWDKGAFLRPEDISPANALLTNEEVRDNRVFLDLLDEATRSSKPLSAKTNARNYAPRLMAKNGRYTNTDMQRRMAKAMGRLLTANIIAEDAPLGFLKADRKQATGLRRVGSAPTDSGVAKALPPARPDVVAIIEGLKERRLGH